MPSLTPAAWLKRLERMLAAQQRDVQLYEDYYAGRHRLAFATEKYRQAFGVLFQALADNYCQIVVDASSERLAIEGFRSGQDQGSSGEAWSIWQANNLDAESIMAHTEAVKNGRAYVMVFPSKNDGDPPRITVEHPSQVIVDHVPGDRRRRAAALKKWVEDDYAFATLYLPGQIFNYRSQQKVTTFGGPEISWQAIEGGGPTPFDVVNVIPLYNNPSMLVGGISDLATAVPLQDAINKEVTDLLVASEFAAFRQRVFIGVQVPTVKNADGEDVPDPNWELKASVQRVLALEGDVKIGEFAASDLSNYVNAITMLRNDLAAQTRTPPHYLLGEIVNASGDALKAAETGLVAKVKRKQIDFSESWEEAIGLALKLEGKQVDQAAETIWRDPEFRSEGEQVDAAVKLRTLGLPLEAIWERVGATPQQIEEWKRQAGLPDRPPPGATTAAVPGAPQSPTSQVPPVIGGQ